MSTDTSIRGADEGAYRIGAAARLTGISAHTLRKWEDRYGLVEPRRSPGGERLYSGADVKRLALVKDLARSGMSLQRLADLSMSELERRLHLTLFERDGRRRRLTDDGRAVASGLYFVRAGQEDLR